MPIMPAISAQAPSPFAILDKTFRANTQPRPHQRHFSCLLSGDGKPVSINCTHSPTFHVHGIRTTDSSQLIEQEVIASHKILPPKTVIQAEIIW
jgi:hypothetical protein